MHRIQNDSLRVNVQSNADSNSYSRFQILFLIELHALLESSADSRNRSMPTEFHFLDQITFLIGLQRGL